MPEFGWTRLAYSLLVMATLAAILQLGSPSAATQTRTPEPPKKTTDETEQKEPAKAELADRSGKAPDEATGDARNTPVARALDPPVFYRPSPATPGSATGNAADGWEQNAKPVCGNLAGFPSSSEVLFPLSKAHFGSYEDTWGAPRPQGGHEGTDLMVPTGTTEYAITDGTVVPVAGSNDNGWNSLGGYAVMLEASHSVGPIREGDLFYYAHLQRASDLEIGSQVRAGQVLGYAGDTGQGPEVTSGLFPSHLHFSWYDTSGARSALDSGAMNPFPLLGWIEANGGALRGGSDARYCEAPQASIPKPSGGQDRWPSPKTPGTRPDLHAGSPEPSPAAKKHAGENDRQGYPTPHAKATGPAKASAHPPEEKSDEPATEKKEPSTKPSPPASRTEQGPPPGRPEPPASKEPEKDENASQPPPGGDDAGGTADPAPPDEKGETAGVGEQPEEKQPEQDRDGKKGHGEGSHPPSGSPDEKTDKGKDDKDEKPPPEPGEQEPDEAGDGEATTPESVEEEPRTEETVPETTTAAPEADQAG